MVDGNLIKSYLEEMTPKEIQKNAETYSDQSLEAPKTEFMKSLDFYHNLLNIYTGLTNTKVFNNSCDYKYEDDRPTTEYKKIILIINFNPLKEFSEITSREDYGFKKRRKNNFHLGLLFNAQMINEIYKTRNFNDYVVKTNSQSKAGKQFWNSLGINSTELYLKGVSLDKYYSMSLESAKKVGFDF